MKGKAWVRLRMQVLAPRTGLSLARVSNHVFCPSNDRVVFVVAGSNPVASTNTQKPNPHRLVFFARSASVGAGLERRSVVVGDSCSGGD